ncbi:heme lyase CcmF/NrfE family subunit [Halothermothrix orenii]|nr:cytochrome c-type biogenesis CcmF C-terminal domain-containing protein [Halothermothrix orenii]
MVTVAVVILLKALIRSNFNYEYVVRYTSRDLPLIYKISALWAGQSGSLLLWLFFMSLTGLIVQLNKHFGKENYDIAVTGIINVIRLFFMAVLTGPASPFKISAPAPYFGQGLNPMLQNIYMAIHPLFLFAAYSGFIVPFSLATVGVWQRDKKYLWLERSRLWVLFSWGLLTAGIITGGKWAYTELGWGGYWAWDPVENASLFPWLIATALLHNLILRKRAGGVKLLNFILISLSFVLTIFGTFLTRSGLLDSVHAFSNGKIGYYFLFILIVLVLLVIYLIITRYNYFKKTNLNIKLFSVEGVLILTGIFLMFIFGGVLLGTLFPVITEVFVERRIILNKVFYNQFTVPFWLLIVFLMGLCPLIKGGKWKAKEFVLPLLAGVVMFIGIIIKYNHGLAAFSFAICIFASGSIIQNFIIDILKLRYKNDKSLLASIIKLFILHKRKPGSYIIHIGIILIVIGITGSSLLGNGKLQVLRPGEEMVLKNYRFEYQGLTRKVFYTKTRVIAKLQVYRGKRRLGDITSEKIFYPGHDQPDTEIGLMSKINEDIYFNLAGWDGDQARIEVNIYPLVSLIWTGALVICIGVVVLVLPVRQEIDYQQGTKSGRGCPGWKY